MPVVLGIRLAIPVGLTWLVVKRASKFAKWAVVVLILMKTLNLVQGREAILSGDLFAMIWSAGFALHLIATICLFTSQAQEWFAQGGKPGAAFKDVFE